jgi:ABC-type branched-subunit amino acid transport system substrate-binding protein
MRFRLIFIVTLFALGCADSAMPPIWPVSPSDPSVGSSKIKVTGEESSPRNFQRPPWQLWTYSLNETGGIGVGEARERDGDPEGALQVYQDIEQQAHGSIHGEEAFAHRLGLLLKMGRSKEVLDEVRRGFPGDVNKGPGPSTAVSLIVAHAYIHEKNYDQALAWFVDAKKRSRGNLPIGRVIESVTGQLIRSWPAADFDRAAKVWAEEPDFGSMFVKESKRRGFNGSNVEASTLDRWFLPATYGFKSDGTKLVDSKPVAADTINPEGRFKIGVVLPLSGKYGDAGQKALSGMKLALAKIPNAIQLSLLVRDISSGDGAVSAAYRELVDEGVLLVLGPLTSEDSRQLASQSSLTGVPFVSFTKKDFPRSSAGGAFRLGGAADDQLKELLRYLSGELAVKDLVVVSTANDGTVQDYLSPLEKLIPGSGIQLKGTFSVSGSPDPVTIEKIASQNPDAVFSTSELEELLPALREIKAKGKDSLVFCGIFSWTDPVVIRAYSELLEGTVIVTPFYRESRRGVISEFVSAYEAENNQKSADFISAQAYDSVVLVAKTVEGVGADATLSVSQFRDRFTKLPPTSALTGQLRVERSGEISRRMSILRVVRGELVEVVANGEVSGVAY